MDSLIGPTNTPEQPTTKTPTVATAAAETAGEAHVIPKKK